MTLNKKNMILKRDIIDFFYQEAEAARESWEKSMELPLRERIRKRKAIQHVKLENAGLEKSKEGEYLLNLSVTKNLSDFKEGDCLILHKQNQVSGIPCTLNKFDGENKMIVSVFPPKMPTDIKSFQNEDLVLDKDLVDLRPHVYYPFTAKLLSDEDYWKDQLINVLPKPTFENIDECRAELDETIESFKLSLTKNQEESIMNAMTAKDYYLIQGPPGTGKSFILGIIILEEATFFNRKVLVIGPNHMAINNTLEQILKFWPNFRDICKIGQSYHAPQLEIQKEEKTYDIPNYIWPPVNVFNEYKGSWITGATPHSLYSSRARGLEFDTLVIDEAGQMTIPLAMMGMIKAKKVILAGDHKQLPPIVVSDEVPDKMKSSIFQRLITKDNCTMLDVSFRMCKAICDFVSELFYEGAVKPFHEEGSNLIVGGDPLYDFKHPIVLHDVEDEGEQTSDKEAEFITSTIAGFLQRGVKASEIGVLSPFRAQAANVRRHVRKCEEIKEEDRTQITADTVDKMQGQEREVIIFSLTAGNYDYMVDMADFLYNPNKLNVAFSRAKSKLVIVGNLSKIRTLNLSEYPHISKMLHSELVTNV